MTNHSERVSDPKLTRRAFVGAAAATAAAAGLAGCAPAATDEKEAESGKEGAPLSFTGEDEFADCELVYG